MTAPLAAPRILHVINHSHRHNGNVHAAVDLACAQAAQGCRVAFCSRGGDFDDVLRANGVDVVTVELSRRPAAVALAVPRLLGLMRRWRPDIVHAHMMTAAVLAWPATRLFRAPLVTTVHNAFERSATLMGVGDRVIAVSGAVASAMAARGLPKHRLKVVLNGTVGSVRHPQPPPPPELLSRPAVVFVGGLHPRKGVSDLITAMDFVQDAVPEARLYIVGEGPCEAEYRAQAERRPHVVFVGSRPDPRGFLGAADVFVLASHADPAPLVISEACEAGCAIVATDVDGIPELLDGGKAGRLVPSREPERLGEAIKTLLLDPAALASARAAALRNAERLSIARVARETLAAYPPSRTRL